MSVSMMLTLNLVLVNCSSLDYQKEEVKSRCLLVGRPTAAEDSS